MGGLLDVLHQWQHMISSSPPCDPNEEEAYIVRVRALEFCGDVAGIARQSHELVTVHSLFTLPLTAES
jgi:hypothetical protein